MSDVKQRAVRAHELSEDGILKEAFDLMKDAYTSALRQCNAKDDMGRYRYAVALNVIDGVNNHLKAVLVQGQISLRQAQEFQTPTPIEKIARIF